MVGTEPGLRTLLIHAGVGMMHPMRRWLLTLAMLLSPLTGKMTRGSRLPVRFSGRQVSRGVPYCCLFSGNVGVMLLKSVQSVPSPA